MITAGCFFCEHHERDAEYRDFPNGVLKVCPLHLHRAQRVMTTEGGAIWTVNPQLLPDEVAARDRKARKENADRNRLETL